MKFEVVQGAEASGGSKKVQNHKPRSNGFILSIASQECLLIQLVVGDSAQMLVGRSMGHHFVCPQLSPKKTLEGGAAHGYMHKTKIKVKLSGLLEHLRV